MDQGGGRVNMHSSLSTLQLQAAVPCYPPLEAGFRGPYASGDRDGESCIDSVLRILHPPSVAENIFDPSPADMSWSGELDSAFVAPGFDELADSVTFDICRTRLFQGYNPGADMSHQMAACHRRIQVQQVPGNHNIHEHMTWDQGLSSALQKLVHKVNGDQEDRASAPAGCCGFSDACLIQDAVDHADYSFSSVTTDATMESLFSSGHGTDPVLEGSYIQQSCREVSRLHYNFSEACELSAVVHSSISLRHTSARGSLAKEQKNGAGKLSSSSEVLDVTKDCHQGYGGLSLVQQDLQFDGSRQTQLYFTSQASDQDMTMNHQGWPPSKAIVSSSDAPWSPSGDLASVCGLLVHHQPALPTATDERAPLRPLHPSVQDTSWNAGLSDQYGLPQSGPMYNVPQDERTVGLAEMTKAFIQRGNHGAHDTLALATDCHRRQLTTLATKRPRRCPPVISEFTVLPVYSTIVSSEIQASEFSMSTDSMGLPHVQPGSDPDASILRRKRKAVSDESSWFGILHQEWSPRLLQSTEQAKSAHEVSVQQVSSHTCASRLTVTQDFQPGTPEGRELRAAASSLMDLCTELVPPVPMAVRRPPKLTDLDMTRLIQAYKQLSASQVLRTLQHFPFVKEADVYSVHPADLISGTGAGQYFLGETKYGSIKKPTRLRITQNGHRWKQQGRTYAIQEGGRTVAFKTYLSYVPLKNNGKLQGYPQISSGPDESRSSCSAYGDRHVGVPLGIPVSAPSSATALRCVKQTQPAASRQSSEKGDSANWVCSKPAPHRKWALWTMEEIALAEDVEMERRTFKRGGVPRPFPVLCKIGCRTPVEDHGCRSQEIPFAVPITPPPQTPLIQARTRKIRQYVRRVAKKARYTCSAVTIAAPPPSAGRTEGLSPNGTYGGALLRDSATSGNLLW